MTKCTSEPIVTYTKDLNASIWKVLLYYLRWVFFYCTRSNMQLRTHVVSLFFFSHTVKVIGRVAKIILNYDFFFSFKNLHSYSYKIFDWTKAMSYLLCWAMCELPLNFIIFIAWNDYQKSCNFFFQRKAGLMLATRQTMLNQQMLNLASIVHLVCDCKQQMPLKMQIFYIHSYRQTSFCV